MPSLFATRADLEVHQVAHLSRMLTELWSRNRFCQTRWSQANLARFDLATLADLARYPLTTKADLIADQEANPPYGSNLTYPLETYTRFHQTSGTKGKPLRWLDTPENWQTMLGCWRQVFEWAGIKGGDRVFFPFSFGPFLGFWTAFEAAGSMGCLAIPGGGLSTGARLGLLIDNQATVVCCTPTYALHLAQAAVELGIDLASQARVHTLIVAGEPGGSIPATRARIEAAWNARVIDHHGLTEVGPMTTEARAEPGRLLVLEGDYIVEVLDPGTLEPTRPGQVGELVVTNLGRWGNPLVRYRTGDLVRPRMPDENEACPFLRLEGGILGRADDMIPLRGNNFYPTSLEAVLRKFAEIVEYRVEVDTTSPLAELRIEVEPTPDAGAGLSARVAQAVRDELLFRADVTIVPQGALPRFEMKATRVSRK